MCMEYTKKRSHEDTHEPISFTTEEMANVVDGYDEPMVITARLGEYDMKRILVDHCANLLPTFCTSKPSSG